MIKHIHNKILENDRFAFLSSKRFRIVVLSILAIFFIFYYKRAVAYLFFLGITAVIIYYTKLYHVPIDVSPLFFLEIVITRYFGIHFTLLYVLLGYILPKTLAGTNMKFDSYVYIAISMFANLFVLVFPGMGLLMVGLLTSIIQYIVGVFFSMTMRPPVLAMLDGIANVANNLLWFLLFSNLVVLLF